MVEPRRGRNLIPAALDAVNRFDPWFAGGFREFFGVFWGVKKGGAEPQKTPAFAPIAAHAEFV